MPIKVKVNEANQDNVNCLVSVFNKKSFQGQRPRGDGNIFSKVWIKGKLERFYEQKNKFENARLIMAK